jgi:hypothetical protein
MNSFKCIDLLIIGVQAYGVSDRGLALDALAGAVRKFTNYQVKTFDVSRDSIKKIIDFAQSSNPAVIGMSIRPGGFELAHSIASQLILLLPEVKIILGGQVPTISPDLVLDALPTAVVVVGEGEEAIVHLMEHHQSWKYCELSKIPNIAFLKSGRLIRTKRKETPECYLSYSLEQARDAIRTGSVVWVEGSRGCSSSCSFCTAKNNHGTNNWRPRNATQVVDELESLYELGATSISFSDFSALENISWGEALVIELRKRNLPLTLRMDVKAHSIYDLSDSLADQTRRDALWQSLADIGLRQVFVGFESPSDTELRRFAKGITSAQQTKALHRLDTFGIDYVLGYIGFEPFTDLKTMRSSLNYLVRTGMIYRITSPLKEMRIQRGTGYEKWLKNAGLLGTLQGNLLYYNFKYKNSSIEKIAAICRHFHRTTAKIYHHSYLTNMIATIRNVDSRILAEMQLLSNKFKLYEADLLDKLLTAEITSSSDTAINEIVRWGLDARITIFNDIATRYKKLLESDFPLIREDMTEFVRKMSHKEDFFLTTNPVFEENNDSRPDVL